MKKEIRRRKRSKVRVFLGKLDPWWDGLWGGIPKVIKFFVCIIFFVSVAGILIWDHGPGPERAKFIGYLFGGAFLFWQLLSASRRATAAEKTAELTEKGHAHERFKIAIEHLGDNVASVRLGGIYSLHQIAQDVFEYREQVFEILCSHIRESTSPINQDQDNILKESLKPTTEIQSILDLLFVEHRSEETYVGLWASLDNVCLRGAVLARSRLKDAELNRANLKNTRFYFAVLIRAELEEADLEKSVLYRSNLERAKLLNANLKSASLVNAELRFADFEGANMEFADLRNATLEYAYLLDAKNLTIEQLLKANTLHRARLPEEMKEEIRRLKPELLKKPTDEQNHAARNLRRKRPG